MGEKAPNHSKGQKGGCMGVNHGHTDVLSEPGVERAANLPRLTTEQRKALLDKAAATRKARHEARQSSTLRRDFLDADLWQTLARTRGLRLPPQGEPPTVSNFRSWLRKIGLTQGQYEEELGCTLAQYIAHNASWPLRAMAGVSLEYQANEKGGQPMTIRDNEGQTHRTA